MPAEKVRLRKGATNGADRSDQPIPALQVSGIVLTKAALVEALRVYVPALSDVRMTEDGEHFWLMLGDEVRGDGQRG